MDLMRLLLFLPAQGDFWKQTRIWESNEPQLDRQYAEIVQDDAFLVGRFEEYLKANRSDSAPPRAWDME